MHSRPFAYLGFLLVLASQGALVLLGDAAIVTVSVAIQLFGLGGAGVCLVIGGLVPETELGPLSVQWFQWIGLGLLAIGVRHRVRRRRTGGGARVRDRWPARVSDGVSAAERATAIPEDGGAYIYVERGMGPILGTVAGIGT